MKKKIDSEVLCEGTCSEFINIIEYLRHLAPGEEVDFTIVEGMFHQIAISYKFVIDHKMEWNKFKKLISIDPDRLPDKEQEVENKV